MENIDQKLKVVEELELVKSQLLNIIDEYHRLITVEKSRLNFLYERNFGDLENDIIEKKNEIDEVQEIIDKIAGSYKNQNNSNSRSNYQPSFNNKNVDITGVYRKIVKKIHPDKSNDEIHLNYWEKVQEAYKAGNIKNLRMFYDIFCIEENEIANQYSIRSKIRKFSSYIDEQRSKISDLVKKEPFSLKDKLNDNDWIQWKRGVLEKKLENSNQRLEKKRKILKSLSSGRSQEHLTKLAS